MKPSAHIAISLGVSYLVSRFFESIPAFFITFIGGVFIDLDHLVDYSLNHTGTLDLKKMYDKFMTLDLKRFYLVLHSYELVFCLWFYISIFKPNILWTAFATGYTSHIILDQLTNPIKVQGYFLSYRIYKKFHKHSIIRG